MSVFDYYQELGVARDATTEQIRAAYRNLAAQLHPDVNRDDGAEDRFKRVSEAYDVLRDPAKRRRYDHFGPDWDRVDDAFAEQYERDLRARRSHRAGSPIEGFQSSAGGHGAGFDAWIADIFRDGESGAFDLDAAFGGSGFGRVRRSARDARRRGGRQTADREATLRLTLDEAAAGGRREIRLADGADLGALTVAVTLPPGLRGGEVMRLSGLGNPRTPVSGGRDAADKADRGDLYVRIELLPHPTMRLVGDDVHWVVDVAPWEAALGADLDMRVFGRTLRLKVPAGSRSGSRLRLRGAGYPRAYGGGRGDLIVDLRIQVPPELTVDERDAFERLRRVSRYRPRG